MFPRMGLSCIFDIQPYNRQAYGHWCIGVPMNGRLCKGLQLRWNAVGRRAFSSNDGHSGRGSDRVGQTLITVSASTVLHLCVSARRSAISDASRLKKNNRLTLTVWAIATLINDVSDATYVRERDSSMRQDSSKCIFVWARQLCANGMSDVPRVKVNDRVISEWTSADVAVRWR